MRIAMMAAALAVTGAAAEAVVYTYDGDFIVDTGPGTPNEIDLTLTLPDSLFSVGPRPFPAAYYFSYQRGTSGETFVFNGVEIDGAGIVLPDAIVNSDPTYALFILEFDENADVNYSTICYDFPVASFCQSNEEGGVIFGDAIYFGGETFAVPQTEWVRTGDPIVSPVPLPAGGLLLTAALLGLSRFRRH